MEIPKISIVTPSFNQVGFIEETLQSVLNQGYENLEYVVIDGGSTDGSVEIIKKYEDRLHYWVSESDDGHGDALNKGFSHTTGEIMAWINSDDKYTPWTLKTVADIFTQFPHVEWIIGFTSYWNDRGAMTGSSRVPKNIYDFLLGNYKWIQQESVFWRRSLWEKAGGCINQDYRFMVDGELWTRFFLHAELYSVDCILGGYRSHGTNRALSNYNTCMVEMKKAIDVMEAKCTRQVLRNYRVLQLLKMFNKYVMFSNRYYLKAVSSVFKDVAYKNIRYKNGVWTERKLPFSLK